MSIRHHNELTTSEYDVLKGDFMKKLTLVLAALFAFSSVAAFAHDAKEEGEAHEKAEHAEKKGKHGHHDKNKKGEHEGAAEEGAKHE
jgi:preprotein translocase subunit SecG